MKKRLIAFVSVTALCFGMTASAFAVQPAAQPVLPNTGYGMCGNGYSLMRDQNGNFLDRSSFEENLDNLINSGVIRAEDRDLYLERYEWCLSYGNGTTAMRGGCGRRGMGCGMYR